MDQTQAEEQLQKLLTVRQHKSEGQRAPHKPLLILLALRKIQTTGASGLRWDESVDAFDDLLASFGKPGRGTRRSLRYPFTHMRNDGIWVLDQDLTDGAAPAPSQSAVEGRLSAELEGLLTSDPELLLSTARLVALKEWPQTVAADVLSAVGFDPQSVLASEAPTGRRFDLVRRARRDPEWRGRVLESWQHRCAFCGFNAKIRSQSVAVEAAHVRWHAMGGPDDLDNGITLCVLHHRLFDRGALGLTPDLRILVSGQLVHPWGDASRTRELQGRELVTAPATVLPAEAHVKWHDDEVFWEPAIA